MLHGDIKVNQHLIGSWTAVRQQLLESVEQVSDYKCEVHWYAPRENYGFEVHHRYSDGADALVVRIMVKAHELRLAKQEAER